MKNLIYTKSSGIGTITINRPDVLNALNVETLSELEILLADIAKDTTVEAVIITGSGDKAFVAGADIAEIQNLSPMEAREFSALGQRVFEKIENLPQPVIAAVNGYALGGGCELAISCDIRIASDKALFGLPEVTLGVIPGFAGTQRLARLIGKGRAKELLFTGTAIDAQEAFSIGLVNKVFAFESLMEEAQNLAKKIISRAPIAVNFCKIAVNIGLELDLNSAIEYEKGLFALCFSTNDQKEGTQAFLEKRRANFTGK